MRRWSEVNWRRIVRVIGIMLVIEGLAMFLGIPFSIWYNTSDLHALLLSGSITGLTGLALLLLHKSSNPIIGKREGYIIVSFSWVIISFFGALPYVFSGVIPNYTDAFFETISGFTTTGATVLVDIESVPHGILFWRSMTHFIGGMGIIVLSLAVLPFLGVGGSQMFAAEVPGLKTDKLHPRITETAKRLWLIYFAFVVLQTILLLFGGMSLFDAICHSFSTMATGGFSTKNDSIAGFSPYIQYVIIAFMILAGTNFTLHYLFLHRAFSRIYRNEEFRYYLLMMLIMGVVIGGLLIAFHHLPPEKAFRDGLFQVVSIVTTTGFVTADYLSWKPFIWFLIFILMFTGGSAGSTGGGIKAIRTLLLIKSSFIELKRLVHTRAMIPVRYDTRPVSQEVITKVLAFFFFYMASFLIGTMVMSFLGLDFETALGSVIASLGNIGPGIGNVGPVDHYGHIPMAGKWVLSFLMLLGRLEIFTILILLNPSFWRN
ncbi:MAG: potassium transporter TrkG [Bacteroidales bacterium]